MRIAFISPSFSWAVRMKTLFFQIEPGFFNPQFGHFFVDWLMSFLQLGQRDEFLFFVGIMGCVYRKNIMGII